jgi:hypothetical protein
LESRTPKTDREFKRNKKQPAVMSTDPRRLTLLALLALLPVAAFLLGRSLLAVLSAASVLLIAGSLYHMFGPAGSPSH